MVSWKYDISEVLLLQHNSEGDFVSDLGEMNYSIWRWGQVGKCLQIEPFNQGLAVCFMC